MTVYSYAELERLWISAGGSKALAPLAAAIAEAESGGNSDALDPNDNGGLQSSFGLWQISNGTHQPPSAQWSNPAVNAQLAVAKYKGAGNSFKPWGTFTSGAYKAFLSSSTTPAASVPGSPTATTTSASTNTSSATCAWQIGWGGIPGTSWLNDIFGSGGNVGSGAVCVLSKTEMRAGLGGLTVGVGGVLFIAGFSLVTSIALKSQILGQLAGPLRQFLAAGAMPAAPPRPAPAPSGGASSGSGTPAQPSPSPQPAPPPQQRPAVPRPRQPRQSAPGSGSPRPARPRAAAGRRGP
jgi:Lysozyme like domain